MLGTGRDETEAEDTGQDETQPEDTGQNKRQPETPVAPWDLIVKTLGGIAAGIGILGFVTVAGGVILFERLAGARIPAEHAVAVVPRSELLAIGASQLLPLAFLVGLAVLVLWLVLEVRKETAQGDKSGIIARLLSHMNPVYVIAGAAAVGGAVYFIVTADHVPSASNIMFLIISIGGGVLLGGLVWRTLSKMERDDVMSYRAQLGWFAILIAITIPAEGAMIGWVQSREAPLVRPAVLFESKSGAVVRGFFIAATEDRVFLAEVDQSSDPNRGTLRTGRMLDFPRDEVLRLSVGGNQTLQKARDRWPELVRELEATLPSGTTFHEVPQP